MSKYGRLKKTRRNYEETVICIDNAGQNIWFNTKYINQHLAEEEENLDICHDF